MTLESSKNLGGVGALLMFVGIFPYIDTFGIVELIGAILVLVALHGFAGYYKENGIFSNALYGIITGIVGVVVAAAVGIALVLPKLQDFLTKLGYSWNGSLSTLPSISGTPNTSNISFSDVVPFITAAIVVFVILWVFAIIATFLLRRSLRQVTEKSGTGLFSTAGLLLLIGAVLIILIGLGLILMWIAALILAIAFFTMKPKEAQPSPMEAASSPTPTPV
ncbi:MAG: DUF996 domain-containing protein [Candidatus Bathyarchaeia archaeon]|jgi:uncharacterized membrane protein